MKELEKLISNKKEIEQKIKDRKEMVIQNELNKYKLRIEDKVMYLSSSQEKIYFFIKSIYFDLSNNIRIKGYGAKKDGTMSMKELYLPYYLKLSDLKKLKGDS